MAKISSSSKSPEQELSLREIGVETSIEYEKVQQIINIVQEKEEEFKTEKFNAQTDTEDIIPIVTPKDHKECYVQEIDFQLTSSREMDKRFKSIFNNELENLSQIDERPAEIEVQKSDKSLQMTEPEVEENIEPKTESEPNNFRRYIEDMNLALKSREKYEKEKIK